MQSQQNILVLVSPTPGEGSGHTLKSWNCYYGSGLVSPPQGKIVTPCNLEIVERNVQLCILMYLHLSQHWYYWLLISDKNMFFTHIYIYICNTIRGHCDSFHATAMYILLEKYAKNAFMQVSKFCHAL